LEELHAGTALRKVSVGERIKWLATAISVTVLDAAAVTCYGGAV
jgi:hypothetical protein